MATTDSPFLNTAKTGKFKDPVLLPSSSYYPTSLTEAFYLCEYLYYLLPKYRQTQKRTVRYFITELEYDDINSDTKDKLDNILKNQLDIMTSLTTIGDYWGCYGNAFIRMALPFTRHFKKKSITPSNTVKTYTYSTFAPYESRIKFNAKALEYTMPDPDTNFTTDAVFTFYDTLTRDETDNLKLIIENPKYISIQYNKLTDSARYIYRFPEEVKNSINNNEIFIINTTPKAMLEAIGKNMDFLFNKNELYHFKGPGIDGISRHGWGLPELIANYRAIWQLLAYLKADEVIALDMILPMRTVSPMPVNPNSQDNMQTVDSLLFKSQVSDMIRNHRSDPTSIQVSPFAFQYNEYFGEGKKYIPKDLIEYAETNLCTGAGLLHDFLSQQVNIQVIPTALRLLQNTYWFIFNGFDKIVKWVCKKTTGYLNLEPVKISLQPPRLADNLDTINLKMNLGSQGLISFDSMFDSLGVNDAKAEILKRKRQDLEIASEERKLQETQENKDQAQAILMADLESGNGSVGGAGGGGGGIPPRGGILDKQKQAMEMAQQLLQMPIGPRKKQLMALETQDVTLYSLVNNYMKDARADLEQSGTQMMKEQNGIY